MTQPDILRTPRDGCWAVTSNIWGNYLAPVPDPLGDVIITDEQFNGFELNPDVPRIPPDLWSRWVSLCFQLTRLNNANCEVSCRLLRNAEDPSRYRILVPEQKVSVVSVRVDSFDKAIDIETGEIVTQFPPDGWRPCGSSHSHNTMDAFFSGTDDQFELGDPGLHIVVGNINLTDMTYTHKASITANKRRFIIDTDKVVDLTSRTDQYNQACLAVISLPKPQRVVQTASTLPTITTNSDTWFRNDDMWDIPDASILTTSEFRSSSEFKRVNGEVDAVMAAVDQLIEACKINGVSVSDCVSDVAYAIDEIAMDKADQNDDPFYWSSY